MTFKSAQDHLDIAYDFIDRSRQAIIRAREDLKQAMQSQPNPIPVPTVPPNDSIVLSEWIRLIIQRHNDGRTRYNLTPLIANIKLMRMAQLHSEDQSRNKSLSHVGSDGSHLSTRAGRVEYNYRWVGENVAMTSGDPLPGWWGSPGHKRNWLSPYAKDIGVGRSGNYWTVVFGWES